MRKLVLIAAMASASAVQAQGQVRIGTRSTKTAPDSVVTTRMMITILDDDELKTVMTRAQQLMEQTKKLGAEMPLETNKDRVDEQRRTMTALQSELMRAQALIKFTCNMHDFENEGFLGVSVQDDTTAVKAAMRSGRMFFDRYVGIPHIERVDRGSPAEKAGLRPGDQIVAFGELAMQRASAEDISAVMKPGAKMNVRILREGEEREIVAVIAAKPLMEECKAGGAMPGGATMTTFIAKSLNGSRGTVRPLPSDGPNGVFMLMPAPGAASMFGATFKTLTSDARNALQVKGDGILVDNVFPNSAAFISGLRQLDVVQRVNGEPIATPMDLGRLFESSATAFAMTVWRGGQTLTVTVNR